MTTVVGGGGGGGWANRVHVNRKFDFSPLFEFKNDSFDEVKLAVAPCGSSEKNC